MPNQLIALASEL